MDTSKEYMKMTWQLDHEFWELFQSDNLTAQSCMTCHKFVTDIRLACCNEMKRVPSPRQDQLQEMLTLPDSITPVLSQLRSFTEWTYSLSIDYSFSSMEQLWLAFVMKELHNKHWLNGEWTGGGE